MQKFTVKVPATTANIGSGFDTAGIALQLYNYFSFDFCRAKGLEFVGVEQRFANVNNLVYETMSDVLRDNNRSMPADFYLKMETNIPVARGLGSSSTCIIAGIIAANVYGELGFTEADIINIATGIEGHPDNVVPGIVGGMVSCVFSQGVVYKQQIKPSGRLGFIVIIEPNEVSTAAARLVMPSSLSYEDAIFNISRASLLMKAFEDGNQELLTIATEDRIHQPYRVALIKNYPKMVALLETAPFITHWVSGSGSTVIGLVAIDDRQKACALLRGIGLDATVELVAVDVVGATVVEH
ncbi:MAG: homoserine kinase [Culicoidibacterales bacterium]